jgi:hypothetical protein
MKQLLAVLGVFVLIFVALTYIFKSVPASKNETSSSETVEMEQVEPQKVAATATPAPAAQVKSDAARGLASLASPRALLRGQDLDDFIRKLEKKYKTKFELSLTADGAPFRLSGNVKIDKAGKESNSEALLSFLADAAPALDIDDPAQLQNPKEQTATLGQITNFSQEFSGIPVEGSMVRVHQDSQGNVFMINSTYIPGTSTVDTTERISAEVARQTALNDALTRYPAGPNQIPMVKPAEKVIYRFADGLDLSWKIVVSQPWAGVEASAFTT